MKLKQCKQSDERLDRLKSEDFCPLRPVASTNDNPNAAKIHAVTKLAKEYSISVITYSFTVWYGSASLSIKHKLQSAV